MNHINELILKYFPEIIIIITLFIGILIYLILKQRKKDSQLAKNEREININDNTESDKTLQPHNDTFKNIPKKREFDESIEVTKKSFSIFHQLSIIVADDNSINQKVITSLLADSPIKIHTADNGQEVLNILKLYDDIDIILMDAHMPIMDGFEASQTIKKQKDYDNILIVALSGDTSKDDINKMKLAGMQEYLQKPLQIDRLFKIFYMYADTISHNNTPNKPIPTSIDQAKGLEICTNDLSLYKQILLDFSATYKNLGDELSKNFASNNIGQSVAVLLDISGIAANIGADKLSNLAIRYKIIIDNSQEMLYKAIDQDFRAELANVLIEIKNIS